MPCGRQDIAAMNAAPFRRSFSMFARIPSFMFAAAVSLSVFACASNVEEGAEDSAAAESSKECSSAKYKEAQSLYAKVVLAAGHKLHDDGCSTKREIANDMQKVVSTCDTFRTKIKAGADDKEGDLRALLGTTLAYRIATGDLDPKSWRNLERALPGVVMQGGMHGNLWRLELAANERGTVGRDEEPATPIRWSVGQSGGKTFLKLKREQPGTSPATAEYRLSSETRKDGVVTSITFERADDSTEFADKFFDADDIEESGECDEPAK
jgi:hypothetical protein